MRPNNEGNIGCFAMGCLGAIAVVVILAVVGVGVTMYTFGQMVENNTDTAPMELPPVEYAEEDVPELESRVDAFFAAVEAGEPAEPLTLTEDEINALLLHDADYKNLGDYIRVDIVEDGKVRADVSYPLDNIDSPLFDTEGRYLNGSGLFDVFLRNGVLYIHGLSFEIKGKPVEDAFMQGVRNENLAQYLDENDEARRITRELTRLEFTEDAVTIWPDNVPEPTGLEITPPEPDTDEPALPAEPAEPAQPSDIQPQ